MKTREKTNTPYFVSFNFLFMLFAMGLLICMMFFSCVCHLFIVGCCLLLIVGCCLLFIVGCCLLLLIIVGCCLLLLFAVCCCLLLAWVAFYVMSMCLLFGFRCFMACVVCCVNLFAVCFLFAVITCSAKCQGCQVPHIVLFKVFENICGV